MFGSARMSIRAFVVLLSATVLVAMTADDVSARRGRSLTDQPVSAHQAQAVQVASASSRRKAKKAAKAKKAKEAKKKAARAAKRKKSRSKKSNDGGYSVNKRNMPPGWSWPPNRAMKDEGAACLAELDALGVAYEKVGKTNKVATPIVVPSMEFGGIKVHSWWRKGPHVMDCHLALSLTSFATQLHELGVREIRFSSIYRWDHVGSTKTLSRHALGLAMDVRSFTDAAGNEAIVKDDYLQGNELLLRLEDFFNDSGGFRTVLTPRNDPDAHDDHFHIEVKVDYTVPATKKKPTS